MVFKHLTLHFLEKYLGEYIEDLDTKQLKVGLWHGNLTIHNVYLKPNRLDNFNLPIRITTGYLEKLTIHIPWKHLHSHPTRISIQGFYVLLEPKTDIIYDAEKQAEHEYQSKMKQVEKVENFRRKREKAQYSNAHNKHKKTFFQRLKFHILRNLELSIENIYIHYQDKYIKPSSPFTFTFVLNHIKLLRTNSEWEELQSKENSKIHYKVGEISNLSINWSSNAIFNGDLSKEEIIKNLMMQMKDYLTTDNPQPNYILRPLNATAKFEIAKKGEKQHFQRPVLQGQVFVQEINVNLNRNQYSDILDLLEYHNYYELKSKYIKYYTPINTSQNDKPSLQRWKFAYNVILNEYIRPRLASYQWDNIKSHLDRSKRYYYLYFQQFTGHHLHKEDKQSIEELERKMNAFSLIYVRRNAEIKAMKIKLEKEQMSPWDKLSNWFHHHPHRHQHYEELDFQSDMVTLQDEKEKLYEAMEYQDEHHGITYPQEYIDIDMTVGLNRITINTWSNLNEHDTEIEILTCATVTNLGFVYKRRPAADDFSLEISLDSLEMHGNESKSTQLCLIQSPNKDYKLLHIRFETNPVDYNCDYRLITRAQSLDIIYHAMIVKKLIEFFLPDKQYHLEKIKEAAYSIYTDINNNTQFLFSENLKKIKDLDLDIDMQPLRIVLPEYDQQSNCSASICLNSGHLTCQGGKKFQQNIIQHPTNTQYIDDLSSVPLKLVLDNLKLVYCNKDWKDVLHDYDPSSNIIQPLTFTSNIYKSIHTDNPNIPIWNITGDVSRIILHVSDRRLVEIIRIFQSIPLPKAKVSSDNKNKIQKLNSQDQKNEHSTKQIYQTVEDMTLVKKTFYEEETKSNQRELNQQLTEIQLYFQIPSINIYLDQCSNDVTEPFMEISFVSLVSEVKMKTYDMEFDLSLQDLIIIHQQFETKDKKKFLLLNNTHNDKLLRINGLLTSVENPLFSSSPYNSIENQISINLNRFLANFQLEIFHSVLIFKDNIVDKLSSHQSEQIQSQSTPIETQKPPIHSFKLTVNVEEFCFLIGNECTSFFYMKLESIQASYGRTRVKTLGHLCVHDFILIDPSNQCRFNSIISKENKQNDLLSFDLSLFNYSKKRSPPIDSLIEGQMERLNIILLYKHVDLLLTIIKSLNTKKTKEKDVSSANHQSSPSQNQFSKIRCQINLKGPRLFIPKHSYSYEAILIDLGNISVQTAASDDQSQSIRFENLSMNRVKFDGDNQILETIGLSNCSSLNIFINYHPDMESIQVNQAKISIKIEWNQIDFIVGKADYLFLGEMLKGNLQEKIFNEIPRKEQMNQTNQQSNLNNDKVYPFLMINILIRQINLTLCHKQTEPHSKLLYFNLKNLELDFHQSSNSAYEGKLLLQNLFGDYLYQTSEENSITRMIDRKFNLEQNIPILTVIILCKPTTIDNHTTSFRQVDGELENMYISVSATYLLAIKDFFIATQSTSDEVEHSSAVTVNQSILNNIPSPATCISTSHPLVKEISQDDNSLIETKNPNTSSSIKTNVNLCIKPCRFILIEDEKNKNSNCLIAELSIVMQMAVFDETSEINASMNDFTIYASNFEELKQSTIKYYIFQPCQLKLSMIKNVDEQNIDVQIGDISIDINPMLIHTIILIQKSIGKQQANMKEKKDKTDSKTIFNPKPFKDSNFWFIQDVEQKETTLKKNDILEIVTGTPSHKKNPIPQEEQTVKTKTINQQLTINLKIIEIKFQLGTGSTTRPVIALCLSEIFLHLKNWSSNLFVSSSIQIELALFNDHLLAWEPLIEPIVDQRGHIVSPWSIKCQTIHDQQNETNDECYFLLDDDDEKSSNSQAKGENMTNFDVKNLIFIRADHLLNITLTKTSLILGEHLFTMFNNVYKNEYTMIEHDDQSILSIHNQTGCEIIVSDFLGIRFIENHKSNDEVHLNDNESIKLTVSGDRLRATHLPTISEQIDKRKQEFSVQIDEKSLKIDINQTWRRVYEVNASSIPNWPIQMLCDSQIYEDRRRIVLSSIIKVSNRTIMPLILLDPESVETKKFHRIARIDVNQEFHVPIQFLYLRMCPRLYFTIDQDDSIDEVYDFMSFEWSIESSSDRVLKRKDGTQVNYVIHKESMEAYSENTDEPIRNSFNICVQLALHLINYLPISIQCRIDNCEQIELKPSELCHITIGNKKSILIFMIPSYNGIKWISEPVDLNSQGDGNHNEQIVKFHDSKNDEVLRMILRVEICRHSYRVSFYCPYWVVNTTDLQFQLKIEHDKVFIDKTDQPHFLCPKRIHSESHKKKAHIRLYDDKEDESISHWSEGFSVNVIKSTGMTSCKVSNDRIYTICINIVTCSFGMSKIITIASSMFIINNSSIELEIIETLHGVQQDKWTTLKSDQVIPFWPHDIKDDILCLRYLHNQQAVAYVPISNKYRTLLHMNDEEYPAIDVQINITDLEGYRIVFSDYKNGDAPILLVNTLISQPIAFAQREDLRTQILPAQHYVYYTWIDPFKPYELIISINTKTIAIQLHPSDGVIEQDNEENIQYTIFHDGPQTVLLFSSDISIIQSVTDTTLLAEPINNYIQLILHSIGIAIINDITRDDLLYVTINPSQYIWTTKQKYDIELVPTLLNLHLEQNYATYIKHRHEQHSLRREIRENRYTIDNNLIVSFDENIGEVSDEQGHSVHVIRQKLDALWIGYAWSVSNVILHARIQHIQADNQLDCTIFPTIVHPIASKSSPITHLSDRPLIELCLFKSQSLRSNTIHLKYFKLLVQEFALCADQGLILALFAFFKPNQNPVSPTINMNRDITLLNKPLESFVKVDTYKPSPVSFIYFDNLHLSPLKIHVSFSMHGSKPDKQLLEEYPLADFFLQILNLAEVQDVTLKLNCYERKNDRYTIEKLRKEIFTHYEGEFLKQIHVVVLGLDVLGNPFGVIRGVAQGVESFFYEPYEGAMAGSKEFFLGVRQGTRNLIGSVVGGTAGALSKVTDAASKSLATLTFDKQYKNIRIQRKELNASASSHILSSGKHTAKDIISSVKDLVRKPIEGAKEHGGEGFAKGVGKSVVGLVAKPTSGLADLTSTSLNSLKRVVTHEQIIHRIRPSRHIGRDGIIRPSIAHEKRGNFIFENSDYEKTEDYIAHIQCFDQPKSYFFASTKRILLINENYSSTRVYNITWNCYYKQIKDVPQINFDPNHIEIHYRDINKLHMTKHDELYTELIPYQIVGEARYIVDKIIETMRTLQV